MRRSLYAIVFFFSFPMMVGTAESNDTSPVPHWKLADYNWMEIQEVVPGRIDTVLLPVGTLEAHGVLNNGADILVPTRMAQDLAPRVFALIAPTIPYGTLETLEGYPGTFGISPRVFRDYCQEVLTGLARQEFRNIIVLNGHGGNRGHLDAAVSVVAHEHGVRALVIDWWSYTSDLIHEIFGEDGGHAGNNESAAVLAIAPELVHPELYNNDLASPINPGFTAFPFPSSITLYTPNEGYPTFGEEQAERYYREVLGALTELIVSVREHWEQGGL